MLAGFMIPARHFSPMIAGAGYGSPSALLLGQQQQQQPPEASQSMPENDFQIFGDEDFESRSGSENIEVTSGYEQDPNPSKKKRHHRHTQHQIQELECFFKECPHPDDKQRKELGRALGLEPLQIKFWFQNKRTQMKTMHERHANQLLRSENEKLRAENIRYKEALSSASCPNCSGSTSLGEMSFDEHHLRIENVQLREEIDRISGIAAKYAGKSTVSHPLLNASVLSRSLLDLGSGCLGAQPGIGVEMFTAGELLKTVAGTSEMERPLIIELAVTAIEELLRMAEAKEPLWLPGLGDTTETLNEEEYVNAFPKGSGSKPEGWKTEGTRETAMVMMNPMSLVEILMDVNQWSAVFSSIVSKALTIEVFSTGVAGNYNGALQVMLAEYQVPSPLVHIRESLFVRYCKQQPDGTWAVVDASLDSLRSNSSTRCRRRPSGCLIQEMPNGYSKVIWVEHVEADDSYIHALYKLVINSGLAFGAKRWVAILERQCERLASAMARNFPAGDVGTVASPEGRKNLLKLAERMVISFCNGVTGSPTHNWSNVSEVSRDDIKISLRKCINDPGRPSGHVINAATSLWLPVELRKLFDFLRNETSRTEWDILSNNANIQEVFHIANGPEEGNCVSILRVDGQNKNDILILQESCFNVTGSYVVYAPVDVVAMNIVLSGGDPDYVALLPSGFAVLPDSAPGMQGGAICDIGSGGSLLTIAFQILVDSPEKSDLAVRSVTTVNHLISCTADKIKASLSGDNVVQST